MKMVIAAWGDLVRNTVTLSRLVTFLNDVIRENKERVEMGLADAEFATGLLATKVGDRPVPLGMDSIFQTLDELVTDMMALQADVLRLDSPEVERARMEKMGASIGQDVTLHLHPLFDLFRLWSSKGCGVWKLGTHRDQAQARAWERVGSVTQWEDWPLQPEHQM
jgi:hypothetical protein